MSSFKDTFTKNSEQEELLNYDDGASYFFGVTVLSCIVIPWTWTWVRFYIWGAKVGHFPKTTRKNFSPIQYVKNTLTEINLRSIEAVQAKAEARYKRWNAFKLVVLGICWLLWIYCFFQLADTDGGNSVKGFNPYEVLGLEPGADDSAIKKAYRKT